MQKKDIGLIGLGVMGASFARNLSSHNISTLVYNRTQEVQQTYLNEFGNEYLSGATSLEDLVNGLEKPRKIIIFVTAGKAVDAVIAQLNPLLEKGDIIVECGNSYFKDTETRQQSLIEKGISLVGCGVSGGEEGALKGPSLMPGGPKEACDAIAPYLETIAAKDFQGNPCVTWVGTGGSGHYVKMIHNGVEYAMMNTLASTYQILRDGYSLRAPDIAQIFSNLRDTSLSSFLIDISAEVSEKIDMDTGQSLLDIIMDKAGQKGTGLWTSQEALAEMTPVTTTTEAVFDRILSDHKDLRIALAAEYTIAPNNSAALPLGQFIFMIEPALHSAWILIFAQCFHLLQMVNDHHDWKLNFGELARIWQGGCIIRSKILSRIQESYSTCACTEHLMKSTLIQESLHKELPHLRTIVETGIHLGIPQPVLNSALTYFDGITKARGSANFIQALRDNFGAHTYERTDKKGSFHTDWS